ncbi:TetR/AcrR family transcriptional regulator [Streptomyces sp. NPDC058231]|uniref:TetR/AcrR family transcriptional regulator n=1 Tax=Streptomyces sp. NPDC058231 TaxID=3346392 RepID=UPI0036E873CB
MAATSHHTPAGTAQPPLGLRERKKIKTRSAIRSAMYRLVAEQGYEATTVEQIAEAAEVSPSTVFRYFPTKEDIVLTDELDPVLAQEMRARPAGESPIDSLRHVLALAAETARGEEREEAILRSRLMVEVPAIRARMAESMSVTSRMLSEILAERGGRDPRDLEVRVFATALLGALQETTLYWAERGHRDDLTVLVNRTFDALLDGFAR